MEKQKVKVFKLTMTILAIAIIVGIIIYMFPVMRELSTKEGQLAFKEKVSSSGILGLLMLFALQVAQIFLIIIPGEPIEILAGMCYGPIWGTVFIMVSAGIISTIIFFLVRKYGKRFVYNFCDKEKVAKIENSKLFKNPNKIEMIMFILFLLPGTPKDLLVYIAGLLPINPVKFVLISVFARFPSVISSTLAGANLAVGDWKKSIVMYLAIVLVAIIVILIANKFDKDKLAEKAIKTIK
ncbi:MAG: VTT domain-containing protein [Clostridium sp.]|nr:VTT domain-containing protein [Clostridium sp.]CCZ18155.1 putative membrane protein [Clostridium sp. CAG:780]